MKKILIIGQAPPAVKQDVPYDTTLLYVMLSWVGISKEKAQEIFDFEAMTDTFPGHSSTRNGHAVPSYFVMEVYYNNILEEKIKTTEKEQTLK